MATALPPKVGADIKDGGGRHYHGRGLGQLSGWTCPACGAQNVGNFAAGCGSCGAGAPGTQVRRPGEEIVKSNPDGRLETAAGGKTQPVLTLSAALPNPPPARGSTTSSLTSQLRSRASQVDYDEIERRVLHALDSRLGGGYTDAERATFYMALECYLALWEDGSIEPTGGLNLEQTRQLMARVAPESGLEMTGERESDAHTPTTPTTERAGEQDDDYDDTAARDPSTDSYDRARAGAAAVPSRQPAAVRPAPEFLDPDHRGDEGGEDDADRDG